MEDILQGNYGGEHNIEPPYTLPPGFRFHPTDEELITYYLARKMADGRLRDEAIADVDLNKHEPWDLPGKAQMMGEKEWYFYCLNDRKYPSGSRTNRATQAGYWKATGKDKEVFMKSTSSYSGRSKQQLVGMKKTLVFYEGRAPRGLKSKWVMHEYRMHERASIASMLGDAFTCKIQGTTREPWVICRLFHKKLPHRHRQSITKVMHSDEEDDAENILQASHAHLKSVADDERGPGEAVSDHINKIPFCSSSQLGSLDYNDYYYAALRWAAAEAACELPLSYSLLQEHSLRNYISNYTGCSSVDGTYRNGVPFADSNASDAHLPPPSLPPPSKVTTAFAPAALSCFPSDFESWSFLA